MSLTETEQAALHKNAWVLVQRPVELDLLVFSGELGQPVPPRPNSALLSTLRPNRPEASHPRSLSRLYGLGAFPFHTDGASQRVPPRLMVLRLATGAGTTTPTLIHPLTHLGLSALDRAALRRHTWLVYGRRRPFLATLLSDDRASFLRYDMDVMCPTGQSSRKAGNVLSDALQSVEPIRISWKPGGVLVVDNWRALHGRPATSKKDTTSRALERVLLR